MGGALRISGKKDQVGNHGGERESERERDR